MFTGERVFVIKVFLVIGTNNIIALFTKGDMSHFPSLGRVVGVVWVVAVLLVVIFVLLVRGNGVVGWIWAFFVVVWLF